MDLATGSFFVFLQRIGSQLQFLSVEEEKEVGAQESVNPLNL
jgi:hypothetical protein